MDCSTPGFPVLHHLPALTQTHVHRVGDAIQPSGQFCKPGPWKIVKSVQFSRSVLSDSLRPHGLQHARPPCPSPTPRVYSDSCPLSWWYRPTISSSVVPFSSCLWSFPASGSFQMSQFFASGGQIHPKKKKKKIQRIIPSKNTFCIFAFFLFSLFPHPVQSTLFLTLANEMFHNWVP